jgi:hypothetical protein
MTMQFLLVSVIGAGLFVLVPGGVAGGALVMVAALRLDMEVALRLVMEVALGPVTAAVLGAVAGVAGGPTAAAVLRVAFMVAPGPVTVASLGAATLTGFATAGVFLVRVLASMALDIRGGGIGPIRVMPIILIPIRTTVIPTTAALIMGIRMISLTEMVMLACLLPKRSKPNSHGAATITVRLTGCWGRKLAMQYVRSRPIKVYR